MKARAKSGRGRGLGFQAKRREPPKEAVSVQVERLSDDGRGVARASGKVMFVADALPGESVKAQVTRSHRRFDEAIVLKREGDSPARVSPQCEYFESCGGCQLQHLGYDHQVEFKQEKIATLLAPLEEEAAITWGDPITSPPYAYRHRARLAVAAKGKRCDIGFKRAESHQVVDVERCPVLQDELNQDLVGIRDVVASLPSRSSVTAVSIQRDQQGSPALVVHAKQALRDGDVSLLKTFAESTGSSVTLEQGGELIWLTAQQGLSYEINSQVISYQPGDFTQVNPGINGALVDTAKRWLSAGSDDRLLDFFCGVGNFSLPLALEAGSVAGYEFAPSMVEKAEENARLNQLANVSFLKADLTRGISAQQLSSANKVLLDPPRAGAEGLCHQLARASLDTIVYISCNPSTFKRDAEILSGGGYMIKRAALADMFPQTVHCELIAEFTRG